MKKLAFNFFILVLFVSIIHSDNYSYNNKCKISIFKDYEKIASGIKIAENIFVTKDSILSYNNFYLKSKKNIYYNYEVIYVDRVSGLAFLRIDIPGEKENLHKQVKLTEDDPIFIYKDNNYQKIGKYAKKIKGYGLLNTKYEDLYVTMPLYNINKKFIGLILGYFQKNHYIFLKSNILKFYQNNLNSILKEGKPNLNIVVSEMWHKNGIKIIKSFNDQFKRGDIIVKIEGDKINNILDFNISLYKFNKRSTLKFIVKRDDKLKSIKIEGGNDAEK